MSNLAQEFPKVAAQLSANEIRVDMLNASLPRIKRLSRRRVVAAKIIDLGGTVRDDVQLKPTKVPTRAGKRTCHVRVYTMDGKSLTLREWAEEPEQKRLGLTRKRLASRAGSAYRWPTRRLLTEPVNVKQARAQKRRAEA